MDGLIKMNETTYLYGYKLNELIAVAELLSKNYITPEKLDVYLSDAHYLAGIMVDEIIRQLRKSYGVE